MNESGADSEIRGETRIETIRKSIFPITEQNKNRILLHPTTQECYENQEFSQKYMHIVKTNPSTVKMQESNVYLHARLNPKYPANVQNAPVIPSNWNKLSERNLPNCEYENKNLEARFVHSSHCSVNNASNVNSLEGFIIYKSSNQQEMVFNKSFVENPISTEKKIHINCINRTPCISDLENYHVYENVDSQEECIYQNVIFSNGKGFPESRLKKEECCISDESEKTRSPENKEINSFHRTLTIVNNQEKTKDGSFEQNTSSKKLFIVRVTISIVLFRI